MPAKQSIYLQIKNNTNGVVPASILNASLPNSNVFNQRTKYAWDITSLVYTTLDYSIEVKFSSTSSFQTYSGFISAPNENALIAALNNLGIGVFWIEYGVGTISVITFNDKITYGQLIVSGASAPPINISWQNSFTPNGGWLLVNVNAVNIVTSNDDSADYLFGNITCNDGDTVEAEVFNPPLSGIDVNFTVQQSLVASPYTTTVLYFATINSGNTDSFSFVASSLYNYNILWGDLP